MGTERSAVVPAGLSLAEVAARLERGEVNRAEADSQSVRLILARNTFTWLNLLLVTLGAATLATGSVPDAAFLMIAVVNTVVGAVQELRAKRTLESLSVVNAPLLRVWRDGSLVAVPAEELVLDDVVELSAGDQVAADSVVLFGDAEVDESAVTGESDPVPKHAADRVVSGTWLVGGTLTARTTAVGPDSYAARLVAEARRFSLSDSELMASINWLLRRLSILMLVIGPILLWRQLQVGDWRVAVRATTAGLVGMIPEGLVLLTTLAFLTAAVRLAKRQVLVQELPAVESLARVDALCTDKTGTLTQGRVGWGGLVAATGLDGGVGGDTPSEALAALASSREANATLLAIREGAGPPPEWTATDQVPFNSARKWSGASFEGHGTWVLGAPEMITAADPGAVRGAVGALAAQGSRVLVLARGEQPLVGENLPADLRLVAAIALRERLRPDAASTLAYFADQGVTVRVVSGDSAATVSAVASHVGLPGAAEFVDARSLPDDSKAFDALIAAHTVFGRVTPEQKRDIVESLRRQGHVIAMTGDGVNDALALKEADLGIAMGSGAPVTRGVAQLVLLNDQFEALPSVVAEGRRVLHNIERVASLFLVKNTYSLVISVVVAIAGWPYPFLPRHLSLVSAVAIGIPGFFLALAPGEERFRPGFLSRTLRFSVTAGSITAAAVLVTYAIARQESAAPDQARTAAVTVVTIMSLWVLTLVARPFQWWKAGLVAAMAGLFVGAFTIPGINRFFNLEHPADGPVTLETVVFAVIACALVSLTTRIVEAHSRR